MATFEQPKKFSFKATEWEDWICDFSQFRIAAEIKSQVQFQVASLFHAMGAKQAQELFSTFTFDLIAVEDGADI